MGTRSGCPADRAHRLLPAAAPHPPPRQLRRLVCAPVAREALAAAGCGDVGAIPAGGGKGLGTARQALYLCYSQRMGTLYRQCLSGQCRKGCRQQPAAAAFHAPPQPVRVPRGRRLQRSRQLRDRQAPVGRPGAHRAGRAAFRRGEGRARQRCCRHQATRRPHRRGARDDDRYHHEPAAHPCPSPRALRRPAGALVHGRACRRPPRRPAAVVRPFLARVPDDDRHLEVARLSRESRWRWPGRRRCGAAGRWRRRARTRTAWRR